MSDYKVGGLESRYDIVKKRTGEKVDDNHYFVLNWLKDPNARYALAKYAECVEDENPQLAEDIIEALNNNPLEI